MACMQVDCGYTPHMWANTVTQCRHFLLQPKRPWGAFLIACKIQVNLRECLHQLRKCIGSRNLRKTPGQRLLNICPTPAIYFKMPHVLLPEQSMIMTHGSQVRKLHTCLVV